MASITIAHSHKNLIFAALVANQTGAKFRENGDSITINDSPELTLPGYCAREAWGEHEDSEWQSLLMNKSGHLHYFGWDEIIIGDQPLE